MPSSEQDTQIDVGRSEWTEDAIEATAGPQTAREAESEEEASEQAGQRPDGTRGPWVRAMGDAAILVELADLDAVLAHAAAIEAADWPDVVDVVPGARTVVVTVRPGTDLVALRRAVRELDVVPVDAADGETVEIPVVYDGPDLAEVGELTGLGVDGVVDAHTGTTWRVGFGGFAPGFAYLTGGDPDLHVERRSEPRTSVPAGAVGLAGEFSGVYPRSSPGGWQLIGRTDAVLWDATRTPPALLTPGAPVRFVALPAPDPGSEQGAPAAAGLEQGAPAATGREGDASAAAGSEERDPAATGREGGRTAGSEQGAPAAVGSEQGAPAAMAERAAATAGLAVTPKRALEIVRVGPLALVQDLGRPGNAAVGVPRSGAADRASLRLANRLVANDDEGAAAVEVLLGGLAVRAHGVRTVALTGAPPPPTSTARRSPTSASSPCAPARPSPSAHPRPACAPTSPSAAASPSTTSSARRPPTPSPASARPHSRQAPCSPSAPNPASRGCWTSPPSPRPPARRSPFAPCSAPAPTGSPIPPRSSAPRGPSPAAATASACASTASPCAAGQARTAQRGHGPRRDPGAAGRRAGGVPRRPPRHRRLPGRRPSSSTPTSTGPPRCAPVRVRSASDSWRSRDRPAPPAARFRDGLVTPTAGLVRRLHAGQPHRRPAGPGVRLPALRPAQPPALPGARRPRRRRRRRPARRRRHPHRRPAATACASTASWSPSRPT